MQDGRITLRKFAFGVAPDLESPNGELAAWFTNPAGAVVQLVAPVAGTPEMARWIVGPAREALLERFPDTNDFVFVLDLSAMTTRDPAFRTTLAEGAKEMRPRLARSILVPPSGGALYHKSLEVSVLLLRGFGVNVEITKSLSFTITSLGLSPAVLRSPSPVRTNETPRVPPPEP